MHNASYMRVIDFDQKYVSHFSSADEFTPEMLSATNSINGIKKSIFFSSTDMDQRILKYKGSNIDLDTVVYRLCVDSMNREKIVDLKTREVIHEVKVCPDEQYILLTEFFLAAQGKLPRNSESVFEEYERWGNYEESSLYSSNLYLIDQNTKKSTSILVNRKTPGHVEFSKSDDNLFYLSSHNLSKAYGRLILHGEGNLTVGALRAGKIEFMKEFSDKNFYRVTSHKIFNHKESSMIAVTVYPNRLYVLSEPELEILHDVVLFKHDSIEKGRLHFCDSKPHMPIWLETSDNGRYVILISNEYIYTYDLILRKLERFHGFSFEGDFIGTAHAINLNDFIN
jgi:hypothetical protein